MMAYVDTSALAKWYLNEPGSDAFVAWVKGQDDLHISSLTAAEMRCLLARRKRMGDISSDLEQQVYATFTEDIELGYLSRHAVSDQHVLAAAPLIDQLPGHALRTFDAMHLAIARSLGAEAIATADAIMVAAAKALEMAVIRFD